MYAPLDLWHTYLLSSYQVVVALSFLVGPLDQHDPLAYLVAYLSHKYISRPTTYIKLRFETFDMVEGFFLYFMSPSTDIF